MPLDRTAIDFLLILSIQNYKSQATYNQLFKAKEGIFITQMLSYRPLMMGVSFNGLVYSPQTTSVRQSFEEIARVSCIWAQSNIVLILSVATISYYMWRLYSSKKISIEIPQAIQKDYKVVHVSSCVTSFEEIRFFCLGENHISVENKKLNGAFIGQHAKDLSLLVVEGLDFDPQHLDSPLTTSDTILKDNYIEVSDRNFDSFRVLGWDCMKTVITSSSGRWDNTVNAWGLVVHVKNRLDHLKEDSELILFYCRIVNLFSDNGNRKNKSDIEEVLLDEYELTKWIKELEEMIKYMKNHKNITTAQSLKEHLDTLIRSSCNELISKIKEKVFIHFELAKKEIISYVEERNCLSNLLSNNKIEDYLRESSNIDTFSWETFPKRTQSMIDTLSTIANWMKEKSFKGSIFLIAGSNHFINDEMYNNKSNYCLTTFYKALDKLPAIVLVPKDG